MEAQAISGSHPKNQNLTILSLSWHPCVFIICLMIPSLITYLEGSIIVPNISVSDEAIDWQRRCRQHQTKPCSRFYEHQVGSLVFKSVSTSNLLFSLVKAKRKPPPLKATMTKTGDELEGYQGWTVISEELKEDNVLNDISCGWTIILATQ